MTKQEKGESAYGFMTLYDEIDARETSKIFPGMDDLLDSESEDKK
jgi:hypothetical protein